MKVADMGVAAKIFSEGKETRQDKERLELDV